MLFNERNRIFLSEYLNTAKSLALQGKKHSVIPEQCVALKSRKNQGKKKVERIG